MKTIQILAACGLLFSGVANAAPDYNGSVKGTVDGVQIDVKAVCERSKLGTSDRITVRSDPGGMESDAKDRNSDGIAVALSGDLTKAVVGLKVLAGGKVYNFGTRAGLKLTATSLVVKGNFKPSKNQPELKPYDVDLTLDCP